MKWVLFAPIPFLLIAPGALTKPASGSPFPNEYLGARSFHCPDSTHGVSLPIYGDATTLERNFARLKRHCEAVGRDCHGIRRTGDTLCAIGETEEQARAKMLAGLVDHPLLAGVFIGTPDTIRQLLAGLEAVGIQEMWLSFPDCLELEPLHFFVKGFLA